MKFTIEQARMLSGLTQVDMAKKLGMVASAYIQYEKYRRYFRMDKAHKFAEITMQPVDNIIFFDGELKKNFS